jgi:hypothetical protein
LFQTTLQMKTRSNKKEVAITVMFAVISVALSFAVFAFAAWEYNPSKWAVELRGMYAFLLFALLGSFLINISEKLSKD